MYSQLNFKQISILIARFALFIIYFWFGILKVVGQSPASPMVNTLLSKIMPFIPFDLFIVLFGLFEILIGILFIIPNKERLAIILFFIHMFTTTLPLFIMRDFIWTHMFVPTLEGQYIIKNIALIACVLNIWSTLPIKREENSVTIN